MSRVLVIINNYAIAELLRYNLERSGFQFDIIRGKETCSVPFGRFVGLGLDDQPVEIDVSSYEVALVDQELAGYRSGCWLVSELVARGVACVGISAFFQETLKAAGAQVLCDQGDLVSFVTGHLAAVCTTSRNHRHEVPTAA